MDKHFSTLLVDDAGRIRWDARPSLQRLGHYPQEAPTRAASGVLAGVLLGFSLWTALALIVAVAWWWVR